MSLFLYDGDCGFCSTCARFIQRRIPTRASVVPWQRADLAALGLTTDQVAESVWWVDGDDRRGGPAAIAALLVDAGSYWRPMGRVLGLRPVLALARPVYRFIARHRHRLPGGTPACRLQA